VEISEFMQKYIKKADILIEALPYIQSFKDKIVVIKYGGTALLNEEIKPLLLQDIVFLNAVGIKPVLVHGGGFLINQKIRSLGRQPKFINGIRVTSKEDMKIVVEILAEINNSIVDKLIQSEAKAENFTNNKLFLETEPVSEELGYVGKITKVRYSYINNLLNKGYIPVISPLGKGKEGGIYNINADSVSACIATTLKAKKLILLTHVKGIMRNPSDDSTLISSLYTDEAQRLIESEVIHGGMIPKVEAGCLTISKGVNKVHIIDGNIPHSLLLEIFTDEGTGTQILKRRDSNDG